MPANLSQWMSWLVNVVDHGGTIVGHHHPFLLARWLPTGFTTLNSSCMFQKFFACLATKYPSISTSEPQNGYTWNEPLRIIASDHHCRSSMFFIDHYQSKPQPWCTMATGCATGSWVGNKPYEVTCASLWWMSPGNCTDPLPSAFNFSKGQIASFHQLRNRTFYGPHSVAMKARQRTVARAFEVVGWHFRKRY